LKKKDSFANKEQELKVTQELEIAKQKALKATKTLSSISNKAIQDNNVKNYIKV